MKNDSNDIRPNPGKFWFTLDNAAKIFPAIINEEITAVFRLTVILKQTVKIEPLRKAVLLAEKRFPYYMVQLKEGFFWYYLEHLPQHIPMEVDDKPVCRKFLNGALLIRILVRENRISIEFSHILTDGGGAFEFLRTILLFYYVECEAKNSTKIHSYNRTDPVSKEEFEDAYIRYFKEEIPPMVKRSKAFHLPYPLKSKPRFSQLNTIVSLEQMKQIAHEKEVSITVYLVSVYLYILQEIYESLNGLRKYKKNKRLRIQIPIDLRKIFPSKTMRNFSLFVMPEIDLRLGHYTFDEIIKTVYHQIKLETEEKLINKNISRNVSSEKKLYIRGIPLFLKSIVLRMKYYSLGTSQYSGVITNLGKIELSKEVSKMVDYFIVSPPPPNKLLKINCGIVGFGDKLVLSFGNITQSTEFEERFLQFLKDQNMAMRREKSK